MQVFYSTRSDGKSFILDETESRHLAKVLRLRRGDHAYVIDGSGTLHKCEVTDSDPGESVLTILSSEEEYNRRNYYLHIAIAPTKNIDRFEWFVEKSVELGIDRITPIICERSERRILKTARSEKIIISAMKQSVKATRTILDEAVGLEIFIRNTTSDNRYIAHCNEGGNLQRPKDIYKPGTDALILIGPEGDFSPAEVKLAVSNRFKELSLGTSRLRTETAGLTACSIVYCMNL